MKSHLAVVSKLGRRSLGRTLVIKVSGFVAVAMLIISLAVTYVMHRELIHQAGLMLGETARSARIQLETQVSYLVEATQRLAANPFMVNGLVDVRARERDLPPLLENFARDSVLGPFALLDFDGQPVFQDADWLPRFNESPELRQSLALGVVSLYVDSLGSYLFVIAPVSYYGTTQGAVVAGFALADLLSKYRPPAQDNYLGLLHGNEPLLALGPSTAAVDFILKQAAGIPETPLLNQLDVRVEVGTPKAHVDEVVTAILSRFVGISVILTLASALLAAGLGQRIARPILLLVRRTLEGGRPCSPLGTGDELEDLAAAFDRRTAELRRAKEEIQAQSDRFQYEANHDPLTGLPNRSCFYLQAGRYLGEVAANGSQQLALVFIDLDRFKLINDSLGHTVGDKVLQEVARRLQLQLSATDQLFRHGGDEFMLMSRTATDSPQLPELLNRIISVLQEPVTMGEHDLEVRASLGVTFYPRDARNIQSLVRNADIAMYQAKRAGGSRYLIFDQQMSRQAYERLDIEVGLRRAIERGELAVHFQPQFDMRSGALIGSEALVRWMHPEKGPIMPGLFIPIAEESRLIVDLGDHVLRRACRQQALWYAQGFEPGRVSVNLAGAQIQDPLLVQRIQAILEETGCRREWLELEVTESFVMDDISRPVPALQQLRDLGISLAIDDFGTGRSSLAYLKRLPVNRLKIDQSFVRNAVLDPESQAVIKVIISLGRTFRLDVLAEGVETREHEQMLIAAGCFNAQGYLYSRPVPVAEMEALLAARQTGRDQR